ncbi:sensor histidine kinase [Paracoccus aminophilus]|uniref:histidine kinase n=1 Tax=Paracoccus aminophilus JCM 7686 TaxID=1367847 RepID=S5XSH4_PARAH|nr:ATP-binding protein [Paracoccus aminophilus]AGT10404.1 two-component sensor histidine kinase [Paracoccus aminophilus JCM 7686]
MALSRRRLTTQLSARVVPTILLTLVVIAGFAFSSAKREIDHVYDAQLINDANVLWNLLQKRLDHPEFNRPVAFRDLDFAMSNQLALNDDVDDYADAHMFRIWKGERLAIYSSTAFETDQPISAPGLSDVLYDGELWRVYTLPVPPRGITVEVGEKVALRETLVANILLNLVLPLGVLVPLIGASIWLGLHGGLKPIRGLVEQIRSRSPDDLSLVRTDALPRDLVPLGRSVNQLLGKLARSLTAERRFADNAAHQLRTPHAGLKLLLQMLQQAETEEERDEIIANLVRSNDKALRLIEQLLRAGRILHQPVEMREVALHDLTASVLADLGPRISQKRQEVTLDGPDTAMVRADEPLLRLLIENLVENAVKYTPDDGRIAVEITEAGESRWCLAITDSGPGIAPKDRHVVFQRFHRVGAPKQEGAGLGLSIVADIALRISARISLHTPTSGQGLRADVLLPRAHIR